MYVRVRTYEKRTGAHEYRSETETGGYTMTDTDTETDMETEAVAK